MNNLLFRIAQIEHPKRCKRISLTAKERYLLVNHLGGKPVTTSHIAATTHVSIQNASATLAKLYKKGYLERHLQQQPSGGFEWVYHYCLHDD